MFCFLVFQAERQRAVHAIDERLNLAIVAVESMLPEGLHATALEAASLPLDEELSLSTELSELAQAFDTPYLYTLVLDEDGIVRFVLSSMSPEELRGERPFTSSYFIAYEEMQDTLAESMPQGQVLTEEYSDRWGTFRSRFSPATDRDGVKFYIGADADISQVGDAALQAALRTAGFYLLVCLIALPLLGYILWRLRKDRLAAIRKLALDELTGLPSRYQLKADLEEMDRPRLVIINILRFREINEHYGPAVGDMVLRRFGRFLTAMTLKEFPGHKTYRVHGDEFALAHDTKTLPEDIDLAFKQFLQQIGQFGFRLPDDTELKIRLATGVALDVGEHQPASDLLAHAHLALQEAESSGQPLVVYHPTLSNARGAQNDLQELALLDKALNEDRIRIHFQAIFRSDDLQIEGYEILARMVDDHGEIVRSPNRFLPIAHRYRLYYRITRTIIQQTLEWMQHHDKRASINLSIADIEHADTARFIIDSLKKSGCADRVSFELLETDAIADLGRVRKFFRTVRALGCRVGIDDLGKDYSNFDRLTMLAVDFVKLDGVVIQSLVSNPDAHEVVGEFIALAHRNGITVTAEYISDQDLLRTARRLRCDYLQGFELGRPQAEPQAEVALSQPVA
ncbi:MAG: EAL domain-containing protein [Pseudomonadota bacterium]